MSIILVRLGIISPCFTTTSCTIVGKQIWLDRETPRDGVPLHVRSSQMLSAINDAVRGDDIASVNALGRLL